MAAPYDAQRRSGAMTMVRGVVGSSRLVIAISASAVWRRTTGSAVPGGPATVRVGAATSEETTGSLSAARSGAPPVARSTEPLGV